MPRKKIKKKSKKPVIKIKEIKSKSKTIEKEESKEIEESEIEEKTEEAEEEVRNIGFQNFIKTSSIAPSLALSKEDNFADEPVSFEDLRAEAESDSRKKEDQGKIEDYVIPSDATLNTYREMIREQNRISSEIQTLRAQEIDIESLGRERQTLGREAHFQQFHELLEAGGNDEYHVLNPGEKGFEAIGEKSTLPFQDIKKTYEKFE